MKTKIRFLYLMIIFMINKFQVPEVVIDNLRFNLGTLLTIAGLYLISTSKYFAKYSCYLIVNCNLENTIRIKVIYRSPFHILSKC